MDVNLSVESGLNFFRDHALWSALIALGIGALVYWKPKGMLRLAAACLVLGAVIYVLSFLVDLTSQGIDKAEKFTTTPHVDVN